MKDGSGWVGFTLVLILFGAVYIYFLRPGVKEEGGGRLQFAVLSYVLVISLMVWTAWFTGSSLLLIGALLFYLSDAILGWNRFVHSFPPGRPRGDEHLFHCRVSVGLECGGRHLISPTNYNFYQPFNLYT